MKRIGVLTFHRAINYGAFLQCFSFTERLQKEFPDYEIEVVDYIAPMEHKKIYKNILREGYHSGMQNMIFEIKKRSIFTKSLKELPLSPRLFKDDNLNGLFEYMDNRYDMIIVGSDAIFNWNQNGFPSAFFLNYNFNIPILSYAASVHGLEYQLMNNMQKEYCSDGLNKFSFIGVRDKNTEEFIHYCDNTLKPTHTCDPTTFIDINNIYKKGGDLQNRLIKKYKIDFEKPFIVIMMQQEGLEKIVYERYGSQYQIVALFKNSKYADYFIYDLNPFEWATLLSMAKIIFTQYFHGTLLALKSGRPVIAIDASQYDGEYEGKLKDLMIRRLNIPYFYYTKDELKNKESIKRMLEVSDSAIEGAFDEAISKGMEHESQCVAPLLEAIRKLL